MPSFPQSAYSSARRIHSAKPNGRWGNVDVACTGRDKSPINMQTYLQSKLTDETREKVTAQVEVDFLRGSIQWYNQRLTEILKGSNLPNTCLLEVVGLNTQLGNFAAENCNMYTRIGHRESNYNDIRELASRSEMKCLKLAKEKEELEAAMEKMKTEGNNAADGEELMVLRLQVQQLNKDLARKRIEGSATISRYEEEIRKLSSLHKDEVTGLRSTITSLTTSLDKWKDMYSKDVARLERQLHNKELEQRTVKRSLKTT